MLRGISIGVVGRSGWTELCYCFIVGLFPDCPSGHYPERRRQAIANESTRTLGSDQDPKIELGSSGPQEGKTNVQAAPFVRSNGNLGLLLSAFR